jgi:hypothetical protein
MATPYRRRTEIGITAIKEALDRALHQLDFYYGASDSAPSDGWEDDLKKVFLYQLTGREDVRPTWHAEIYHNLSPVVPQIVAELKTLGFAVSESRPTPSRSVLTIEKKEGKK